MNEPSAGEKTTYGELDRTRAVLREIVAEVQDYAIFLLDPQGHVISWNRGAERIKGYRDSEIVGRHFSAFYPPEVVATGWPDRELELARAEGRFQDEGWRVRRDGSRFWASVTITTLRDGSGEPIGFLKITRDLTERREREEALRRSEERFRLLVESVRDYAIFMIDPGGHISSWNAGAAAIKGYAASEILGRHFSIFYPPEVVARKWPEHELEVARREGRFEDEGWRLRKDGSRFWANVLITALRDGGGELVGFAKITRDMTSRKRIESLEEESRQTSEFLAMLGHELRNPLAPIRNALGVLQQESDRPRVAWSRDLIERQVVQLARIVDDLLDVSRVVSGRIRVDRAPVDFAEVVRAAVEATRPGLEARGHALELDLPASPVRIVGDATRLSQVVTNLLVNAIKYTPEGGHIRVVVEETAGYAVLRVRDTGIGIAEDLMPRIFDPFVQGRRGLDRAEGGLGIGLTLVRRIVRLHAGRVEVSSEGPGRGSEFIVRLPMNAAASSEGHDAPGGSEPADGGGPGRRLLRVLVVDDNRDAAESLVMVLRLAGHDASAAYDGPTALEAAVPFQPDVAVLDIGLPGMDGYELARRFRETPALAPTTLVAVTGYGTEDDRRRSRDAGFGAHLVKPVDPGALLDALDGLEAP